MRPMHVRCLRAIDPSIGKMYDKTGAVGLGRSFPVMMATLLLEIVQQIHLLEAGCKGVLSSGGFNHMQADQTAFSARCQCGALLANFECMGTSSLAAVPGNLPAGSSFDALGAQSAFADVHTISDTTYFRLLLHVVVAIDELYEEQMAIHRAKIRAEEGRQEVGVDRWRVFFLHHKDELEAPIERGICIEHVRLGHQLTSRN